MIEATIGEGKFCLEVIAYRSITPLIKYHTLQRFQSDESRQEFKIMAKRHGMIVEKEYNDD